MSAPHGPQLTGGVQRTLGTSKLAVAPPDHLQQQNGSDANGQIPHAHSHNMNAHSTANDATEPEDSVGLEFGRSRVPVAVQVHEPLGALHSWSRAMPACRRRAPEFSAARASDALPNLPQSAPHERNGLRRAPRRKQSAICKVRVVYSTLYCKVLVFILYKRRTLQYGTRVRTSTSTSMSSQ